jgi:hypothetical protein
MAKETPGRQRATSFLEQLQRATYDAWHLTPTRTNDAEQAKFVRTFVESQYPSADEEQREDLIKAFAGELARRTARVPTAYEEPGWYAVMENLSEDIGKSADEASLVIPTNPLLGTLPTGQINAMTLRVPGSDDYLIVFEWQLFLFALLLSKAVARALPLRQTEDEGFSFSAQKDDIAQRIDSDKSVVYRFADVLLAYAATGEPSRARPYLPEVHYGRLADVLRRSMELFVMGHEYAHIILGHLSSAQSTETTLSEAEMLEYSWVQEYQADMMGSSLMIRAMLRGGMDASMSYWGCDFFFSAIDVMDKAVSVLKGEEETAVKLGSHPPTKERREMLRRVLPEIIGEKHANDALGLSRILEDVTDLLWQRTRPVIAEARSRGVRPAPWWQG